MGYTYFLDDDGVTRTTAHSIPEFLLRGRVGRLAGGARRLELQLFEADFNPLTRSISGGETFIWESSLV
jgi:hypothetical protein